MSRLFGDEPISPDYNFVEDSYFKIFTAVCFVITTLLFPFIIYAILYGSGQMKKYKYYLMLNAIFCYSFLAALFVARPTYLMPSSCFVVNPVFPGLVKFKYILFYWGDLSLVTADLMVMWCIIYRWSQSFVYSLDRFFDESKWIYVIYAFFHAIVYAIIYMSATSFSLITDPTELAAHFLSENPRLPELVPNAVCFHRDAIQFIGKCMAAGAVFSFCLGTSGYAVMLIRIQKMEVGKELQMMLFRAISAQLFAGYLDLLIPMLVIGLSLNSEHPSAGRAMNLVHSVMSVHTFFDYALMIYYITPYRKILTELITRRKRGSVSEIKDSTGRSLAAKISTIRKTPMTAKSVVKIPI